MVVFDISMSLDGYVTAPGQTRAEPLGRGGERLHAWLGSAEGRHLLAEAAADLGAVICGRRCYDDSLPWWGSNGPAGVPTIVVTHRPAEAHGVYRFATGIADALAQARALAGSRTVTVMGGAEVGRQFLAAGLVDELSLHVVPIVLGGGTRMFGTGELALAPTAVVGSPDAVHLRFKISSSSVTSASEATT